MSVTPSSAPAKSGNARFFRSGAGGNPIISSEVMATGAAALIAMLVFFMVRDLCIVIFENAPSYTFLLPVLFLAGAAFFARIDYAAFPRSFSVLTRVTAIGLFVYLLVERPGYTLINTDHADLNTYVDWGYWPALLVAAVGLFRPAFLFPAALYTISVRYLSEPISGFKMPDLDIRYMMDMAMFLAFGACLVTILPKATGYLAKTRLGGALALVDRPQLALCLAFIAFGLHLGNYFWSGYEKLIIGPHVWTWAFENKTQNILIVGLKRGVLPSGSFPTFTQWLFDGFAAIVVASNTLVLLAQLFAVLAPLRLRWLMIVSLFYDLFHIGIYLFGGLFFWPWIWNNVSIMLAVKGRTDEEIGWLPKFFCVVTVLLGFTNALGASATLAWFDLLDIKIPVLQAETADGKWVDVPVSFFMNHSQPMSMGFLDRSRMQGHYPPSIWGSVLDYGRASVDGQCLPPSPVSQPETPEARSTRIAKMQEFILAHHKKMVDLTEKYGRYFYYFHSHHHPSNPLMNTAFDSLDLKTIRAYRMVTQSVCLGIAKGALVEKEIARYEVMINVR